MIHDLTGQVVNDAIPHHETEHQNNDSPNLTNETPNNNSGVHGGQNQGGETEENSEVQPDSEPDQGVHDSMSDSVAVNPVEVPIPDAPFSDGAESQDSPSHSLLVTSSNDHWVIEGKWLTRIHREPRDRLFSPTNVCDCPVPIEHLKRGTNHIDPNKGSTCVAIS